MSTKKQKERKKKAREEKSRARVATRRYQLGQLRKEEKQKSKLDRKFREKIQPIIKDAEKKRLIEEVKDQENLKKLERNLEILKALEEEYLKEQEQKKQLNKHLEDSGHKTLKEKLDALEGQARANMTEKEAEEGFVDLSNEQDDQKNQEI